MKGCDAAHPTIPSLSADITNPVHTGAQWLREVSKGDYITFKISPTLRNRMLCVRVLDVVRFPTFGSLLKEFGHSSVLPGVATDNFEGIQEYYKYQNRAGVSYKDLETQHGVVGILLATL